MSLELPQVDVQYAYPSENSPTTEHIQQWVAVALAQAEYPDPAAAELSVRIVDEAEGRELNLTWRNQDKSTNVLSFPYEALPGIDVPLLGDIVVCAPVVMAEAAAQNKTTSAHWAHLIIHGSLHLLGYDHIEPTDAEKMESLEIRCLAALNYPNPYKIS
jgi:probable rRNA maturation factor